MKNQKIRKVKTPTISLSNPIRTRTNRAIRKTHQKAPGENKQDPKNQEDGQEPGDNEGQTDGKNDPTKNQENSNESEDKNEPDSEDPEDKKESEKESSAASESDIPPPSGESKKERARRILRQHADFGGKPPIYRRKTFRRPEKDW